MMKPDGILRGMADALQWKGNESVSDPNLFVLPKTTVRDLAKTVQERIGIGTVRVVGNPDLEVTHIAFEPGAASAERHLSMLRRDDVEALVIGEVPEWETIEYVSDAAAQGTDPDWSYRVGTGRNGLLCGVAEDLHSPCAGQFRDHA